MTKEVTYHMKKVLLMLLSLMLLTGCTAVPDEPQQPVSQSAAGQSDVPDAPAAPGKSTLNLPVKSKLLHNSADYYLDPDGLLWGWNDKGTRLFLETEEYVTSLTPIMADVAAVYPGKMNNSLLVLGRDGSVWHLGYRPDMHSDGKPYHRPLSRPEKVLEGCVDIMTGDGTFYALTADNRLLGWGYCCYSDTYYHYLGSSLDYAVEPVLVMENVAALADNGMLAAVKTDGSLWIWGHDGDSEKMLGLPGFPQPLCLLPGGSIAYRARNSCYGIDAAGTLHQWRQTYVDRRWTVEHTSIITGVKNVSYDCWLMEDGTVRYSFAAGEMLKSTSGQRFVSAQHNITAALTALNDRGELFTWAENEYSDYGWIGRGRPDEVTGAETPACILDHVTVYHAGMNVAVRSDGSLWCWAPHQLSANENDEWTYDGRPYQLSVQRNAREPFRLK